MHARQPQITDKSIWGAALLRKKRTLVRILICTHDSHVTMKFAHDRRSLWRTDFHHLEGKDRKELEKNPAETRPIKPKVRIAAREVDQKTQKKNTHRNQRYR